MIQNDEKLPVVAKKVATQPYTLTYVETMLEDNLLKIIGKSGAGDGIRTHDPNLGKVVLYP